MGTFWPLFFQIIFMPILPFVFLWKSLLRLLIFSFIIMIAFFMSWDTYNQRSLKSLFANFKICIILYWSLLIIFVCLFWELVTFPISLCDKWFCIEYYEWFFSSRLSSVISKIWGVLITFYQPVIWTQTTNSGLW